MSRENVEIVRRIQPGPEVDLVAVFREDSAFEAFVEAVQPLFHPDFEVVIVSSLQSDRHAGLRGLRAAWLDWLEGWDSYRVEVEELLDAGDDVVVLVRDYARRAEMETEVAQRGASIWTVREGTIARAAFYPTRMEALEAAGLRE
jgi:ketosteroid isomerase-like protein